MRRTRFIHVAGFRLNSPYSGLRNPSAAVDERLRTAPFDALRNLQALCKSKSPDFLLIAGGVFDLVDRSIHAQLAFRDGLSAIVDAGVPIYLVHGPEDPAAAWLPTIDWPDGVHVMGAKPEWIAINRDGETIALLQGASRQSSTIPGVSASDFLAAPGGDAFTIGLVNEIASEDGDQVDSRESLPGLHYWALGPTREGSLSSDPARRILSTGPIQALSHMETGPHGCYVVETDEAGRAGPSFVALDSVRWENLTIDVSDVTPGELISVARHTVVDALAQAGGRDLICRLEFTGAVKSPLPNDEKLLDDLRDSVLFERPWAWIDRVENLTAVQSGAAASVQESNPGPLLSTVQTHYESIVDNDAVEELVAAISTSNAGSGSNDNSPETMSRIARDAHALAVEHLATSGDDRP